MDHVVLEIRKHHVWKMVDALRDILELSPKQQLWIKMDTLSIIVAIMVKYIL